MSWWPWSRPRGIEPVKPHCLMPTVVVPFRALKPGVKPSKPRPQVPRLILEEDTFVKPIDFDSGAAA